MADEVKLNIKPVFINPAVDTCSDTVYIFQVSDESGNEVDLRGFTAKMQLRPFYRSKKVLDELTTENGRLHIRGANVTVRFPADVTAKFKFERAVYDLVIMSLGGIKYRLAQGEVEFRPGVTQWTTDTTI